MSFTVDAAETLEAKLLDVDDSGEETAQVDVTDQSSADLYREFQSGLIDGGEITLKLFYDPDVARPTSGQSGTLTITWPTGVAKGYQATANIKSCGKIEARLGERIIEDVTFKITGKPNRVYVAA